MTNKSRLLSGKVLTNSSANVSSSRYQFLDLSSAEPNLGTSNTGDVLTFNSSYPGGRRWIPQGEIAGSIGQSAYVEANTASANTLYLSGVDVAQNTRIDVVEGVDLTQNTRISIIEGVDVGQNTRMSIIEGVDITQNTNITNVDTKAQAAFDSANTKLSTSGGTISGSLSVTGNLTVLGTTTTINTSSFTVNDSLIQLGVGNYSSDLLDIGISAHYNDGTNAHTGIIRDSTTKEWFVFKGYTSELTSNNNININHASFAKANINADYFKGNVAFPDGTVQATAVNLRITGGVTAPLNPTVGDLWYDTDIDVLLRYTYDGTSNNWIDITGPTIGRSSYIRPSYAITANVA